MAVSILCQLGPKSHKKLTKNRLFHKNLFFHYCKWYLWGLGVSRVTARTIRRRRHKFSADLVLHGIRKSTFRKYWNFNVLEMVLKTFHFVPGLSRTPLLFIFDISPTYFCSNIFPRKIKTGIWVSENPGFVSVASRGVLISRNDPPKKSSN